MQAYKKLKHVLRKYWWIILLAVITFLSYGQTLNMYFWVDDWGMAYKMRYPAENIPNFGPGVIGDGVYRWNVAPFIGLYPYLGFNAWAYFLIGLVFYFLASISVYFLAKEIFQRKIPAFIAATIFASGYIGSYAMYRLSNSYQLVHTAIIMLLTAWVLLKHYRTGKIHFYVISLLLYSAAIEFLFLRTHGIIISTLAVGVLAWYLRLKVGSRVSFVLKQIPFVAIWFWFYVLDPRGNKTYGGLTSDYFLPNTIKTIFGQGHFELFNNLLITFTSVVAPTTVLEYFFKRVFLFGLTSFKQFLHFHSTFLP